MHCSERNKIKQVRSTKKLHGLQAAGFEGVFGMETFDRVDSDARDGVADKEYSDGSASARRMNCSGVRGEPTDDVESMACLLEPSGVEMAKAGRGGTGGSGDRADRFSGVVCSSDA